MEVITPHVAGQKRAQMRVAHGKTVREAFPGRWEAAAALVSGILENGILSAPAGMRPPIVSPRLRAA
jgi:hypothetical protein